MRAKKPVIKELIEKLKKAVDIETCPVCHTKRTGSCKCFRSDSTCKNGHEWHLCTIHNTIVMGHSDHSIGIMTCTCIDKIKVGDTVQLKDTVMISLGMRDKLILSPGLQGTVKEVPGDGYTRALTVFDVVPGLKIQVSIMVDQLDLVKMQK